jgi:hypothetical protein
MFTKEGLIDSASERAGKWRSWPSGVYHHIVPYGQLEAVWNRIVETDDTDLQRLFLETVVANAPQGNPLPTEDFLTAVATKAADQLHFEFLQSAITWQAYNLALGPKHRPALPDPGEGFDRLSVIPTHLNRINRLDGLDQAITRYLIASKPGPTPPAVKLQLSRALEDLRPLLHLDIIPQHDVNWYSVAHGMWSGMPDVDRLTYENYVVESRLARNGAVSNASDSTEYATEVLRFLVNQGRIAHPPGLVL